MIFIEKVYENPERELLRKKQQEFYEKHPAETYDELVRRYPLAFLSDEDYPSFQNKYSLQEEERIYAEIYGNKPMVRFW